VTTDGGETWKAGVVPGAESLHSAMCRREPQGCISTLLWSGYGFSIYKTVDGGETWTNAIPGKRPQFFL